MDDKPDKLDDFVKDKSRYDLQYIEYDLFPIYDKYSIEIKQKSEYLGYLKEKKVIKS